MPLTAEHTEYVPLAGTHDEEAGGPSSSSRPGADEHQPVGRGDLESGGSDGALEGGEGDSAWRTAAGDGADAGAGPRRRRDDARRGGDQGRDATATEPTAQTAARLRRRRLLGVAGAGASEQGYIAISYVQTFSLFTVPDFIDWPENGSWLDWLHRSRSAWTLAWCNRTWGRALFAARLAPPLLVLGWGLFVVVRELGTTGRRGGSSTTMMMAGTGCCCSVCRPSQCSLWRWVLYLSGLWDPTQSADGWGYGTRAQSATTVVAATVAMDQSWPQRRCDKRSPRSRVVHVPRSYCA